MQRAMLIFAALLPSTARAQNAFQEMVNTVFGYIVETYAPVLMYPVPLIQLPLIVFVMTGGGLFFTFRYGFINIRMFKHAFKVIAGKYDNPEDEGEITHFQALSSSLSATVGLGNIAGVAVAIGMGGPGAILWMWLVAFFGMSLKFSSCTFGQLYRIKDSQGQTLGGPMVYLDEGLKQMGFPRTGKVFGIFFALMTIFASFGAGNMFQANQTYKIIDSQFPGVDPLVVGVTLSFFAGVVLIGGIRRIGEVTSKLVPFMCAFYIISCLTIIFFNFSQVPAMFADIVSSAFAPKAAFGGVMGVMIQGVKRGSFSSEAGLGSAAIAHSAAKTKEPVREGIVGMIGPFIDTHLVCTMTALAILITNSHLNPEFSGKGVEMTASAFQNLGSFMPVLLMVAIVVFAYSTVISWSYYGERATEYLFGRSIGPMAIRFYRLVYVFLIILGPVLTLNNVIDFADLAILSMAFPNILGMIMMSKIVREKARDYIYRYQTDNMPEYHKPSR